ncbi:nickel/cobalt transporter [Ursidibacter sp. B-7004-1]
MSVKIQHWGWIAVGLSLIFATYFAYPYLLWEVAEWQKIFNLELSNALKTIQQAPQQAGLSLMLISFLYGIFHAIGPGHGKFILTSYLSLEKTKLPQTMRVTLLSALVQGLVAVVLVTILVVIFTLSRSYFNVTLKWVERGSFLLMILFGSYWLWQSLRPILQKKQPKKPLIIRKLQPLPSSNSRLAPIHQHSENCGCGHKHLPSAKEMDNIQDWKSMWLVVFSIGLRPCSGAILVLFLAYTLDLYLWGVASAMMMAVGTALTLSCFACLVLFARNKAVQTSRWYLSVQQSKQLVLTLKLLMGLLLIGLGVILFHSSFIETSTILFKR